MSKYEIDPRTAVWQELRDLFIDMAEMLGYRSVDMVELAKVYELAAKTMLKGAEDEGLSSARLAAAAKALDLRTPKSELEAFLHMGATGRD